MKNPVDAVVEFFSPTTAVRRASARNVLAHYEAAKPSRQRKFNRDQSSPNQLVQKSAAALRAQARNLERNHDIARGIIRAFVNNVVGASGIGIEPQPRNADGTINTVYADALREAYKNWQKTPEVTHTYTFSQAQRVMCRTWMRDGEGFAQMLTGLIPTLDHGTRVPFSFEMFEADLIPLDYDDGDRIHQGIERNAWGRKVAYHVYKNHPGEPNGYTLHSKTKRVLAANILQVASLERMGQLRGVSEFASVITRLEDVKDYEESERIAAKVAASLTAYVKRGNPDDYQPQVDEDGNAVSRDISLSPGTIIDSLAIGEEIGLIDSKRPNPNALTWRQGQLRAVASGVGASYSTIARAYDGTYSSQRQELVEQWVNYAILTDEFVGMFIQPIWEQFVLAAHLSGVVPMPKGMTIDQANDCLFIGQSLPWIDPLKEAAAWNSLVRDGFASEVEVIRKRGQNPRDVLEQIKEHRKLCEEAGLVFDSNAKATQYNGAIQNMQTTIGNDGAQQS
ncbi:MAG: phage portal protein [Hydrogenophaga sp.]|nr:phage portal protein [Hydrogenophaga sp.]